MEANCLLKRKLELRVEALDQCPQLVLDGGKYAECVCVSFPLWNSHFFLTNGVSQARA